MPGGSSIENTDLGKVRTVQIVPQQAHFVERRSFHFQKTRCTGLRASFPKREFNIAFGGAVGRHLVEAGDGRGFTGAYNMRS
jgi:hypothetical protein